LLSAFAGARIPFKDCKVPDYNHRDKELQGEDMPTMAETFLSQYREVAAQYIEARNNCLNALLPLVADDEPDHRNAARWVELCEATSRLHRDLFMGMVQITSSIVGANAQTWATYIGGIVHNETGFFDQLALVVAADARDHILGNMQEIQAYMQSLDKAWEQIISQVEETHKDEQESYKEILELVKETARQLAEDKKNWIEKSAVFGGWVSGLISKVGDLIEFLLQLHEGTGKIIEMGGELAEKSLEYWTENNRYLRERMERLLKSIEAEKGGALPIFKEIRQQVYDYWNEKGAKTSRVHLETARSSLDSWKSSRLTSGSRDDAESFSADIFTLLSSHMDKVEKAAKDFEEKWNGIFLGSLHATTQDKLTDAEQWKQDVESLLEIEFSDKAADFLSSLDEIYGKNYTEPFGKLKDAVEDLPDENEHKKEVLDAIADLREKIQSQIAERLPPLKEQIGMVQQQLSPGSPDQKAFEERMSEIENLVV